MNNPIRSIKFFIDNVLSFPLRFFLALYPMSTIDLVDRRRRSKLPFLKHAYNCALYRIADIPETVNMRGGVNFVHNSYGTVIHPKTSIEEGVKIYQNVTIGRGDIWEDDAAKLAGFEIKKNAILCAGAKIICSTGKLTIGEGSVIGANAVLTHSTGDYEIWAGVPAVKIGYRKH